MLKVVFPHSFSNLGGPVARLVDLHRGGIDRDWMQKRAAVMTKELATIRPEKGHSFIHLISMGAMEFSGSNRNGDAFNEKSAKFELPEPKKGTPKIITLDGGLMQYHKTFTKYAHVFKDHQNKSPELASGSVVAEAYNPDMRRGELIIKVADDKWAPELEKLARGEDTPVSMSCRVPFDICSVCGNQAASRREYCDHLKYEMGQVKEGGYQVFAINDRPCFFDISSVFRPADRIAYSLQKVAADGTPPEDFISSAEIADLWGITAPRAVLLDMSPRPVQEKLAALERMAAMEKQIEATGRLYSPDIDAAAPSSALPSDTAETLRSADWNGLMGALGQANICLPVKDFFRLVLGNKYDSVAGEMDNVQSLLPGMFSRMLKSSDGVEDVTGMQSYDPATSLVPKGVREAIDSLMPSMSLGEEPVRRRVSITIIKGAKPVATLRKSSSDRKPSSLAQYMARQYAGYQLAFARTAEGAGDRLAQGMAVLQNYVE